MSRDFNGTTDLIDLGSPAGLDDILPITIAMWARPDTMGEANFGRLFDTAASVAPQAGYRFFFGDGAGANRITFNGGYTTTDFISNNNADVSTAVWQFFAATFKEGDGGARLWKGTLSAPVAEMTYVTRTAEAGTRRSDAANNKVIGNRPAADRTMDGLLAHPSVWNQVLTVDQLNLLRIFPYAPMHRFSVGGTVVTLKGYWPLWESAAATALDHSGNGNNGTVTGTSLAEEPPFAFTRRGVRQVIRTPAVVGAPKFLPEQLGLRPLVGIY